MADSNATTFIEGPRAARITPDDHGAVLSIVAWYCAVVMVLAVGTRILIKAFRTMGRDDPPILIALVFAIGYVIAVSEQVIAGFGKKDFLLSGAQIGKIQRSGFAADLLFVPTIFFAKLSGILFIQQLLVEHWHVQAAWLAAGMSSLWAISSLFVVGLQCGTKSVWASGAKCIDLTTFWIIFETVNILIDVFLIALPSHVVAQVQMKRDKKATVIVAFSFRISAIASSATRIYYLRTTSPHHPRWSFALLPLALCTTVELSFNIIAACIPFMKAFMDAFDSGRLGIAPRRSVAGSSRATAASYYHRHLRTGGGGAAGFGSGSRHSTKAAAAAARGGAGAGAGDGAVKIRDDEVLHQSVIAAAAAATPTLQLHGYSNNNNVRSGGYGGAGGRRADDGDADSRESLGSDKMIIQQTRAWTVQYDDYRHGDDDDGAGAGAGALGVPPRQQELSSGERQSRTSSGLTGRSQMEITPA